MFSQISNVTFEDRHESSGFGDDPLLVLEYRTFMGCFNLKTIRIPPYVNVTIQVLPGQQTGQLFRGCYSLETAILPYTMTRLPSRMFEKCYNLKLVTFENGVIRHYRETVGPQSKRVPQELEDYDPDDYFFYRVSGEPNYIGESCFEDCFNLVQVKFDGIIRLNIYIGPYAFSRCRSLKSFKIPQETYEGEYQIEVEFYHFWTRNTKNYIAEFAFRDCISLAGELVLGSCETGYTLGHSAFRGCININRVELHIKNTGNSQLLAVPYMCFFDCHNMQTLKIAVDYQHYYGPESPYPYHSGRESEAQYPNGTYVRNPARIGTRAFGNCYNLRSVQLPDSIEYIAPYAFQNCDLSEGIDLKYVFQLGSYAFENTKLTEITIFEYIEMVDPLIPEYTTPTPPSRPGRNAISNCYNLKKISIIRGYLFSLELFYNCPNLEEVDVQSPYMKFSNSMLTSYTGDKLIAFIPAANITELTLPASINFIAPYAFNGVQHLKKITIEGELNETSSHAFNNAFSLEEIIFKKDYPAGTSMFENCTNLMKITGTATLIGDFAFRNCPKLETISFKNDIKELGTSSFEKSGIKSFAIPDTVTKVGTAVFLDCINLSSVTIGKGLTKITSLFAANTSITSLTIPEGIVEYASDALKFNFKANLKLESKNSHFTIVDNCLIEKSTGKLVTTFGPLQSIFIVPSDVTEILPNSISPEVVFHPYFGAADPGVTSVIIPKSVTQVQEMAFGNLPFLYNVCYNGTSKFSSIKNKYLRHAYAGVDYVWNSLFGLNPKIQNCDTTTPHSLKAEDECDPNLLLGPEETQKGKSGLSGVGIFFLIMTILCIAAIAGMVVWYFYRKWAKEPQEDPEFVQETAIHTNTEPGMTNDNPLYGRHDMQDDPFKDDFEEAKEQEFYLGNSAPKPTKKKVKRIKKRRSTAGHMEDDPFKDDFKDPKMDKKADPFNSDIVDEV